MAPPTNRMIWLKEWFLLLRFLITPFRNKARRYYEIGADHNYFTEKSHYLNMGYWRDHPSTLDEACENLARFVGEKAQLGPEDTVLDVGFGFADQDIFWAQQFAPKSITGINIAPSQVEAAQKRITALHLEQHINLQVGSATDLQFADNQFDKVLAVECAFHFLTREKFFQEAYRVLRPGGRMVLNDSIPLPEQNQRVKPFERFLARSLLPIPKENVYPTPVYRRKLQDTGFKVIELTSIREEVLPPMLAYLATRLQAPEIIQRVHPAVRKMWQDRLKPGTRSYRMTATTDYVLVVAEKPMN